MRLDGVVAKLRDEPYRSGRRPDWIKVRCSGWRQDNRERHLLLDITSAEGGRSSRKRNDNNCEVWNDAARLQTRGSTPAKPLWKRLFGQLYVRLQPKAMTGSPPGPFRGASQGCQTSKKAIAVPVAASRYQSGTNNPANLEHSSRPDVARKRFLAVGRGYG
jgi:hypothetical protein